MKQVSLQEFQQLARDIAPAARAVLMARVYAQMERERVDAYVRPIFDSYGFVCGSLSDGWRGGPEPGTPITDMDHLYLCTDDARLAEYYAECDTAHRAHGFTGPHGHCPALTAANMALQVESALIDLTQPLFGVDSSNLYGENRKKYLELLIGACLKAEKENDRGR